MSWFTRFTKTSAKKKTASHSDRRARLRLEGLETRLAPASVFVVPLSVAADGSHFHSLTAALPVAGTGGTVTIEPGTTPDPIAVNVGQPSIVIQGDLNIPASILGRYDINVLANGVTLQNLNLGNVQFGGGFSSSIITKNLIVNLTELGSSASNGASQVTFNTITGAMSLTGNVLTATSDLIANNKFFSMAPVMLTMTASAGDVVSSNQFFGDRLPGSSAQIGIQVTDSGTVSSPTTIANNTLIMNFPGSLGIGVFQSAGNTSVNVLNNAATSLTGIGLTVTMNNASLVRVLVQGNDYHNDQIGINLRGDAASTNLNVDLGGGSLGSLGGNDFRGFRTTGTTSVAAVLLTNTPGGANVPAQRNIFFFSGTTNLATTVVNDGTHGSATGTGNIDVSNALSPAQSTVQAMYNQVLGRTGSLSEINGWVAVLNSQGQNVLASSILRSTEGLGRIVDSFYIRFLGRLGDQNGRAGWIGFLQGGGTLEAMTTAFVTSPEYINRINTDFVQSLYINILGRTGSQSELAAWNNNIQALGLTGIANGFSFSLEYKNNSIVSFYQQYLHRTPSASEIAPLVNGSMDILSCQQFVLASAEFAQNG